MLPLGLNPLTDNSIGMFSSGLHLAFCQRPSKLDNLSIEGFLVHELAHGTSAYDIYSEFQERHDYLSGHQPRMGFHYVSYGGFLEEGFADYLRGMYLEANIPKRASTTLLKRAGNRGLGLNSTRPLIDNSSKYQHPLPVKYLFSIYRHGRFAGITTSEACRAGFGVELLCKKDPGLFAAMIRARNNLSGIREVARRIDGISRGLYVGLERIPYSQSGFMLGLKLIIDRVYGGELILDDKREIID
jgi:hypothetical protein